MARYLFVPLAEAVVFAMLASYVLSRTLVPTLVMWFYRGVKLHGEHMDEANVPALVLPFVAVATRRLKTASTVFASGYRAPAGELFRTSHAVCHVLSRRFASARGC